MEKLNSIMIKLTVDNKNVLLNFLKLVAMFAVLMISSLYVVFLLVSLKDEFLKNTNKNITFTTYFYILFPNIINFILGMIFMYLSLNTSN